MLAATISALENVIEIEERRDEWDEFPVLHLITDDGGVLVVGLAGGSPAQMILMAAPAIYQVAFGRSIVGLVLRSEGWALAVEGVDSGNLDAEIEALQDSGRGIADHPAAVEVKMFTAVDAEGMEGRRLTRGAAEVETFDTPPEGRVPDILQALLRALQKM